MPNINIKLLSNSLWRAWFLLFLLTPCIGFADYKAADEAAKTGNWELVVKECISDANSGEKNCQSHIGWAYKMGLGVPKNVSLSVEYLKKCASQGQRYCEEMLGVSYRRGVGVEVNYQEALRLFTSASQKGNPWANNSLGEMYRLGQGVAVDFFEAAKNYRIAANKGNGLAQANLALLYRRGQGVEKNGETAFYLASQSSQQNFGAGWNQLGLLYRDGFGVRQNSQKAIESFKNAVAPTVKFPTLIAYSNLGAMYLYGIGLPSDGGEAVKWLELGVKHSQLESTVLLSEVIARGANSVPADPVRAFTLAKQAYDWGSADAANNLGWFYRDGIGTPRNLPLAIQFFSEARDRGVVNAYVNLGKLYLEGKGVGKDTSKANEYFLVSKSQIDRLGVENRTFIEDYFAKNSGDIKTSISAPSAITVNIPQTEEVKASQKYDASQQALIERLEKLQKQIENLQSSANNGSEGPTFQGQVHMAVRKALIIVTGKQIGRAHV